MKNLKSFMVLDVSGVDRLSYRYEEIDESGNPVIKDGSGSIYVVDELIKDHINAIRDYIRTNRLEG